MGKRPFLYPTRVSSRTPTLVFGGSFDPPHLAHVRLPRLAANAVGAEQVLYIPAAKAPHKLGQAQTEGRHRAAMLALALQGLPWAALSTLELDRAAQAPQTPSYTVDTLAALREQEPLRPLRLLIGSDQLLIFPQWRDWRRVIELAEPVVMLRAPETRAGLLARLPEPLDPSEWAPRLIELPPMDCSSTQVRQRLGAGESPEDLVSPSVADYIRAHGLYA